MAPFFGCLVALLALPSALSLCDPTVDRCSPPSSGTPALSSRYIVTSFAEGLVAAKTAATSAGCDWILDIPLIDAFVCQFPPKGHANKAAALLEHVSVIDVELDLPTPNKVSSKGTMVSSFPSKSMWAARSLVDGEMDTCPSTAVHVLAQQAAHAQVVPYGLSMIQADQIQYNPSNPKKICIVTIGLDLAHPDLCGPFSACASKIEYLTLLRNNTLEDSRDGYGTYTVGIVAAINNTFGSAGVDGSGHIPVRVLKYSFRDTESGHLSDVFAAIDDCVNAGTAVIYLDVSFEERSAYARFLSRVQAKGVLVVAASGYELVGTPELRDPHYPASFDSVISVTTVDRNSIVDPQAVSNAQVELAAPGNDVVSTSSAGPKCTLTTSIGLIYCESTVTAPPMFSINANLVDCGVAAPNSTCVGAAGNICLIKYTSGPSRLLVEHCKASGGVAAIIYTEKTSPFADTTRFTGSSALPAVGVLSCEGFRLLATLNQSTSTTIEILADRPPHGYVGRTDSAAGAMVAAVAAVVWSNAPAGTTAATIRLAMRKTALDLGSPGRDKKYGFGLVQAKAALDWINKNVPNPKPVSPRPLRKPLGLYGANCTEASECFINCVMSETLQRNICQCWGTSAVPRTAGGCTAGEICVYSKDFANYCAKPPGSACVSNSQCSSNSCVQKRCACALCTYDFFTCPGGCPTAELPRCVAATPAANFCAA